MLSTVMQTSVSTRYIMSWLCRGLSLSCRSLSSFCRYYAVVCRCCAVVCRCCAVVCRRSVVVCRRCAVVCRCCAVVCHCCVMVCRTQYLYKDLFNVHSSHHIKYIMTGKSKPKLLKIVCKRAQLMRTPYRDSSWTTNQISQTNKKKSLFVNKTEEKYRSNVVKLNFEKKCSSIQKVCIIQKFILHLRILSTNYYYSIF
jgi:hypothetical protein